MMIIQIDFFGDSSFEGRIRYQLPGLKNRTAGMKTDAISSVSTHIHRPSS